MLAFSFWHPWEYCSIEFGKFSLLFLAIILVILCIYDLIFSVFSQFVVLAAVDRCKWIGKNSKTDFIKVKEVQHSFQLPVMYYTLSGMLISEILTPCHRQLKQYSNRLSHDCIGEWKTVWCSTFSSCFPKLIFHGCPWLATEKKRKKKLIAHHFFKGLHSECSRMHISTYKRWFSSF